MKKYDWWQTMLLYKNIIYEETEYKYFVFTLGLIELGLVWFGVLNSQI